MFVFCLQLIRSRAFYHQRLCWSAFNLSPPRPTSAGARDPLLSRPQTPGESHDRRPSDQQQQQQQQREAPGSPATTQPTLRRTPRRRAEPRRVHLAAASVGFTPSLTPASEHSSLLTGLGASLYEERAHRPAPDPVEDPEPEPSQPAPSSGPPAPVSAPALAPAPRDRHKPHPAVRVSRNTRSAILYALEEALRRPNRFTPDIVEESASMADLMAVSGDPTVSNGSGLASPRRPTAGPAPTGSPSGIRGPRMIMQERAAREARQKAEAEKLATERNRAEQEARLVQEAQRRSVDRRSALGHGGSAESQQPVDPRHQARTASEPTPASRIPETAAAVAMGKPPPSQALDSHRSQPQAYTAAAPGRQQQQPPHQRPIAADQAAEPVMQPTDISKPRNSFPHAFERWETLSAHWEGLTSYWIRKLEQNKDEVNRDPLSQQLARQVTDLSAAGANLFHAVVELQRLRASSERKFQRWFFETRAELERAREVNAMMDAALQKERRDRADAIRDALDQERGSTKIQKQLAEMRKELSISKEEARRAWEELGRREQEERDRTYSLQAGQPTMVGGVQVVPMTHGGVGRNGAAARDSAGYPQEYGTGPGYPAERAPASPSPPPAAAEAGGYQPRQQQPGQPDTGSRQGGYSEGGHDTPATSSQAGAGYEPPPTSDDELRWTGAYSDPQDYSGQGYGTPGWETVPRHHHPTRLSDVIEEEDERSRTSASQMSRG
ncbi:hypothetical protein CDD83_10100 [Cordyceps sp. RAO-2017]|nr:hypothetical protein CDD83_10100 [Cordyceps sp. RAO-2017]